MQRLYQPCNVSKRLFKFNENLCFYLILKYTLRYFALNFALSAVKKPGKPSEKINCKL